MRDLKTIVIGQRCGKEKKGKIQRLLAVVKQQRRRSDIEGYAEKKSIVSQKRY